MLATPAAAAAERGAPALPSDVVLITCVGSEFALKGLLALEVGASTAWATDKLPSSAPPRLLLRHSKLLS